LTPPPFRLTGTLPPRPQGEGRPVRGDAALLFDYTLASHLHMSLAQVRRFPNVEWLEWAAFLRYRNEMEEAAMKKAQQRRPGRRF
jgi:hypothetical protein